VYDWWVFLHIVGVVGFLMAHGVSAGAMFILTRERNPDRVRVLLQMSGASMGLFYASLGLLLLGGIVAGFLRDWWSQGWIWVALFVLIGAMVFMYVVAGPYYRRIRRVIEIQESGSGAVGPQDVEAVFASGRPWLIAVVGLLALVFIVYLMVLKPF
jgi:Predicted integral membrane protein (DUF2269)